MDRFSSNASSAIHTPIDDVSTHIKSLQARLGFARFKMKQGWTNSTLLDVEQLWKQKQRQSINELPKPRFTQRDIIDKRVYIPSPGARNAKSKKAKLVRTYSMDNSKSLCFHHYNHGKKQHHKNNVIPLSIEDHSPSSPSSTYSDHDQHTLDNNNRYTEEEPPVRNSLDYLSYAIAMTEREEITSCSQPLPDISEVEPNLIEEQDKEEEDQKMLSPPSSPATSAAAKAIMMFVNNNNSQQQPASSP